LGVIVLGIMLMVFNAAFNNISVILWPSVSLVEEIGVTRETTDVPQVTNKHYHIMLNPAHLAMSEFQTRTVSGDRY